MIEGKETGLQGVRERNPGKVAHREHEPEAVSRHVHSGEKSRLDEIVKTADNLEKRKIRTSL